MRRLKTFRMKVQAARRKFNRNRQKLDVSTQTVREALIVDLENAFEFAINRMRATQKEKNKQFWARIIAYTASANGQTPNQTS